MNVEVFIWNNINFLNVFAQTIKLHKDAKKKTKTLFKKSVEKNTYRIFLSILYVVPN